jgi:hypothetical protein
MRLWVQIASIFLGCVLLSLGSVRFAGRHLKFDIFRSHGKKPWQETLAIYALFAPFALFSLGAALQAQLHRTSLSPVSRLLIAAMFVAYPFAVLMCGVFIQQRGLYAKDTNSPANPIRKP